MVVLPLATLQLTDGTSVNLNLSNDHWLFYVFVLAVVGNLTAVFMYKNRPMQMKAVAAAMILSTVGGVGCLVSNGSAAYSPESIAYTFSLAFPAIMIIFGFMAILRIRKDEDLVRSMDRLR